MLVDPSQFDMHQTATQRTADLKYRLRTHHGLCPSRTLYVRTQALLFPPLCPSLTLLWLKMELHGLGIQVTVLRRARLASTKTNILSLSLLSLLTLHHSTLIRYLCCIYSFVITIPSTSLWPAVAGRRLAHGLLAFRLDRRGFALSYHIAQAQARQY